jgi:hypothetical protein
LHYHETHFTDIYQASKYFCPTGSPHADIPVIL